MLTTTTSRKLNKVEKLVQFISIHLNKLFKSKSDPKFHDFSISENVTPSANLKATGGHLGNNEGAALETVSECP